MEKIETERSNEEDSQKKGNDKEQIKTQNKEDNKYEEIFDLCHPEVIDTIRKLPPFEYEKPEMNSDNLEYRPLTHIKKHNFHYLGQWIKGTDIREGKGIAVGEYGRVDEGWRVNDKLEGKARMIFKDGTYEEGSFSGNLISGFGIRTHENGDIYEGEFKDDLMVEGKYTFTNGNFYIGSFKDDKRHGEGKLFRKNGVTYDGD